MNLRGAYSFLPFSVWGPTVPRNACRLHPRNSKVVFE